MRDRSVAVPQRTGSGTACGLLQRKCACGAQAGVDGACADCRATALQRSSAGAGTRAVPSIVHDVLRSPGESLAPATRGFMAERFAGVTGLVPRKGAGGGGVAMSGLTPNRSGDRFEQDADNVAARVVDGAGRSAPDDAATRLAHSFAGVRVHHDARAGDSARAVGAHAYTVGQDIVFGHGAYAPGTVAGQRLLAHELAHTLQQRPAGAAMLMGAWEKAAECGESVGSATWIEKVVVDQETPQTVTVTWSDGTTESDACSAGKGHCCVDAANPSGVACTVAGSQRDGSNCTPITQHMGFPVKNRVRDHGGVEFWTEFVPARAIALHKYAPVDGTPLSHGCVRLNEAMAQKIFCNVRQNQTWVQVHGFARPSCDHPALRDEWTGDFAEGGQDLSKADGDTVRQTQETRRELNAAFGRTLTVEEIRKLTANDIPHCSAAAPLPKPAAP